MPSWSHPFLPQPKVILIINFVLTIPLLFFTVLSHFKSLHGIMFMCFWIFYQWSQSKYLLLWLTSFIYVMCIANHFLFFVVQNSIVWVYHNLLLNSIADEKYFFSQFESTEYHATMNILHLSWCMCWRAALGYIYI